MNKSLAAVEKIVEHYLTEYKSVSKAVVDLAAAEGSDEATAKIKKLTVKQGALLKRVSQLRSDKRRTTCLKFAHTIDDPIAITGEEFDGKPWLFPCLLQGSQESSGFVAVSVRGKCGAVPYDRGHWKQSYLA
jgi:hypothetical protein